MYLFLDTETDGLPKSVRQSYKVKGNYPNIVQLAWIVASMEPNGKKYDIVQSCNFTIRPDGYTIPEEASNIHGITQEKANDRGYKLKYVLTILQQVIQKYHPILVCHNIKFDYNVLMSAYYHNNIKNTLRDVTKICTMVNTRSYCNIPSKYYNGPKNPKLSELVYTLFQTSMEDQHKGPGAHDAMVDVTWTMRCFFELSIQNHTFKFV